MEAFTVSENEAKTIFICIKKAETKKNLPLSQIDIQNVKVKSGIPVSGHKWDIGERGDGVDTGELKRHLGRGEGRGDEPSTFLELSGRHRCNDPEQ